MINKTFLLHPLVAIFLQSRVQAEVERLRLELKNTLAMYNQACRDLVYARKKVMIGSVYIIIFSTVHKNIC